MDQLEEISTPHNSNYIKFSFFFLKKSEKQYQKQKSQKNGEDEPGIEHGNTDPVLNHAQMEEDEEEKGNEIEGKICL